MRIRYKRRADVHQAFLLLACLPARSSAGDTLNGFVRRTKRPRFLSQLPANHAIKALRKIFRVQLG
jgi:hypothetical protein